ncbi:MAG TPA: hypothetical protein DGX96_10655 [Lachnospiraceae bacterium]|nr:hypothetical protein [Lachnospiraceae bacterium]
MYCPYLRGRLNELLALRELAEKDLLGQEVVPILEPIKMTPTLTSTLQALEMKKHSYALILNPAVGDLQESLGGGKRSGKCWSLKSIPV